MPDEATHQISHAGYAALEAELHELETEGRRAIAERIKTAREWGDLSENAEYHDAKEAQAHLETKILRRRSMRDSAVVVETTGATDVVALGSLVTVRDLDGGREQRHEIVGAAQSDPAAGRLSIDAPLGRALSGAKVGDEVGFDAPRGRRRLEVVAIEPGA